MSVWYEIGKLRKPERTANPTPAKMLQTKLYAPIMAEAMTTADLMQISCPVRLIVRVVHGYPFHCATGKTARTSDRARHCGAEHRLFSFLGCADPLSKRHRLSASDSDQLWMAGGRCVFCDQRIRHLPRSVEADVQPSLIFYKTGVQTLSALDCHPDGVRHPCAYLA